jgi:hypothetical protein
VKALLTYVLAWIPMALIGVGNGVLRVSTYGKHMDDLRAHQISTFTGAVLMGIYIYAVSRLFKFDSGRQAILVGLMWIVMTVCFEFAFGRYVAGYEWSRLFRDYDLSSGRVWLLLLIWVMFAPYIFHKLGE